MEKPLLGQAGLRVPAIARCRISFAETLSPLTITISGKAKSSCGRLQTATKGEHEPRGGFFADDEVAVNLSPGP